MSRKRRSLRPEEEELWKRVAKTANPLHATRPQSMLKNTTAPQKTRPIPKEPITPFEIGGASKAETAQHRLTPSIVDQLSRQPVQMDGKAFGKLRKGKLVPEARIDLHGMTLAQAHPALTGFILNAHAAGKRLVLVITGKGKRRDSGGAIPERHGALKHEVPHWLQSGPLRPLVLQVVPAHLKHGGSGAYYVYLRRHR